MQQTAYEMRKPTSVRRDPNLTLHNKVTAGRTVSKNGVAKILDKASAHAEAKKIDPNALLGVRLFPTCTRW